MDRHPPNWTTRNLTLSTLLLLLLLAGVHRSMEFKMLHLFQDSETDKTPIRISKERLPEWFWTSSQKTISVELVVTLNQCIDAHSMTLFLIGEDETLLHFEFHCLAGLLNLNILEVDNFQGFMVTVTTEDGRLQALLNFQLEIDSSKMTLILVRKIAGKLMNLQSLQVAQINTPQDKFFTLNLPQDSNTVSRVKNVYVVDKFFASSESEFHERYRGLALLRQALYFYMEPAHSTILRNRSRFNHSHAVNGKLDGVCWELHSQFNPDLRLPLWSMQNFRKELLSLPLDSVALHPLDPFSIVLNLRLYLRNNLEEYLTNSVESFYLFRVFDEKDSPIFSLQLMFQSFDSASSQVWYAVYMSTPSGVVNSYTFADAFQMGKPLSLESVHVLVGPKSPDTVDVDLHFFRPNLPSVKLEKTDQTLNSSKCRTLFLGDPFLENDHLHPPFVVHLLDLLVFEGGYFLTDPIDPGDVRMVSVDTLEVLPCKGNPTPSRFSGNPSLDRLHRERLATATSCRDLRFNSNCTFANCELCGDSECLVCEEGFVLRSKVCEASADPVDPLSRLALPGPDIFEGDRSISRQKSSHINILPQIIGLSVTIFNNSEDATNLLPWSVAFGSVSCYLVTQNTLDQGLKETLFGSGGSKITNKFYYPLSPGEDKIEVLAQNESFTSDYLEFPDLCPLDLASFGGNFTLEFCADKMIDFSDFSFFPGVSPVGNSLPDNQYISYPGGSQKAALANPCMNNCKCGKGQNIHQCAGEYPTCGDSKYPVTLKSSPVFNACLECDPVCKEGCSGSSGSKCNEVADNQEVDPPVDGTDTNVISLPEGTEEVISPVCPELCDKCDQDSNCVECSRFPLNWIFEYKVEANSFEPTLSFFCEECPFNCSACTFAGCVCEKSASAPLARLDDVFNVCIRLSCDNCSFCESTGKCLECKEDFSLDSGVCVRNTRSNCEVKGDKLCTRCQSGYFLRHSECAKCPSFCGKCDFHDLEMRRCDECKDNYILFKSECLRIFDEIPTFPVLNRHFRILSTLGVQVEPLSPRNCELTKNGFSNICKKCKPAFYLSNARDCIQCPPNVVKCNYLLTKSTVQILECASRFFLDASLSKCVACPENCLTCSEKGCETCVPNYSKMNRACVLCLDPSCEVCDQTGFSFRCLPGFRLSEDSRSCQPCPANCKYRAPHQFVKCQKGFTLDPQKKCKKRCESVASFYSSQYQKCVPCSTCELCYKKKPTDCSSCLLCQRACQLDFGIQSASSFFVESPDIIFPDSSELEYFFEPKVPVRVSSLHNSLQFVATEDTRVPSSFVLDPGSLTLRHCKLTRNLMVTVPVLNGDHQRDLTDRISDANQVLSTVFKSAVTLTSVTPLSSRFNFLAHLVITNQVFSYSFVKRTPLSGVYFYVSRIIRRDNLKRQGHFPLSHEEGLYILFRKSHLNIMSVQLIPRFILFCVASIAVFLSLHFCYLRRKDEQVKELEHLFIKKRMDRKFMKNFFRVFAKKISRGKMVQINDFFRSTKRKIRSSKLDKTLRRSLRFVYKRRFCLVFDVIQIYGIPLSHLCAKSVSLCVNLGCSWSLLILGTLYHLLLGGLLFIPHFGYSTHALYLEKYVHERDKTRLKEYFTFRINIFSILFSLAYIYLVVLFGDALSFNVLSPVAFALLYVCFLLDTALNKPFFGFVASKFLVNFLGLLVLMCFPVEGRDVYSLLSDSLFLVVNLATIGVQLYFSCAGYIDHRVDRFIEQNTMSEEN